MLGWCGGEDVRVVWREGCVSGMEGRMLGWCGGEGMCEWCGGEDV